VKRALHVLAIGAALALLVWFGVPMFLRRSLPQRTGEVRTPVGAAVEITFDAKGIPQIWAKTDADVWFAMGWLHASDRLFQMELIRRMARGELSEVFGEAAFEIDAFQRRIGFARSARTAKLDPATQAAMQRYVDGVNTWIAQAKLLPPELVILRLRPRTWTVEDCLAIGAYQTWFSHELMDQDKRYQKVMEKLGMPGRTLAHAGHPWSPPTVPDLQITKASNSWVVAASRSTSRAALHAADPHLSINQVPGLWYIAGLHSAEGLNAVGVTYGGAPFVVMGHNDDIAFSFTVASVDLIDYYDDVAESTVAREAVVVKGEKNPRIVDVRRGARGVMLDDKTSLHWAGFDFSPADVVTSALRLQKAKTFEDFRRAVTGFGALDANWIFSDRAGNIGYQLGAPVPIREYDTYVRQKASDPRTGWMGYRRLEETPHAFNPERGYLASCNNQALSSSSPSTIPGFYDPYRIIRADVMLREKRAPLDMQAMQLDLVSGIALRWKGLAADGAAGAGMRDEAQKLRAWDGAMRSDSREAALFAAWWRSVPREVFEDELGEDWTSGRVLLDEALTQNIAVDDRRTQRVETRSDIAARAMTRAKGIARGRTWGEACTLTVAHPLSRAKILDTWLHLNRGPFAAAGDNGSLNANFYSLDEETGEFRSYIGPSMRFVLDWSEVDSFSIYGALGQSGNPFSEHYDDFLELARHGGFWLVPFSREKVFEKKVSVLRLVPQDE
jgi:penicillin amidase